MVISDFGNDKMSYSAVLSECFVKKGVFRVIITSWSMAVGLNLLWAVNESSVTRTVCWGLFELLLHNQYRDEGCWLPPACSPARASRVTRVRVLWFSYLWSVPLVCNRNWSLPGQTVRFVYVTSLRRVEGKQSRILGKSKASRTQNWDSLICDFE